MKPYGILSSPLSKGKKTKEGRMPKKIVETA